MITPQGSIILVEDDPDLMATISAYLETSGFSVVCAENGDKALRILDHYVPDVAVVDLSLPDVNGTRVCEKIKTCESLKSTLIIMISGSVRLHDRLAGYLSGASKYLSKPFDMEDLIVNIQRLMLGRGVRAASFFDHAARAAGVDAAEFS